MKTSTREVKDKRTAIYNKLYSPMLSAKTEQAIKDTIRWARFQLEEMKDIAETEHARAYCEGTKYTIDNRERELMDYVDRRKKGVN